MKSMKSMKNLIKSIIENNIIEFKKYFSNEDSRKLESLYMDYLFNKNMDIYIEQIEMINHEPDCKSFLEMKKLGFSLEDLKKSDLKKIKYLII